MAITLEDFEELVFTYARSHGQPFIKWQDRLKLRQFIGRHLGRINEEKKLIYDDNITFATTSDDTGLYPFMDEDLYTSVGRAKYVQLLEIEYILVNGVLLTEQDGTPGLWSVDEANRLYFDYRTMPDGRPGFAFQIPPESFRLIPAPDAAYNITICGWIHHFDLTADGTADAVELWLSNGAIDPMAMAIAGELILPEAEGPALQAAEALIERGMQKLSKASSRATSFLQGPQIRGERQTMYSLN